MAVHPGERGPRLFFKELPGSTPAPIPIPLDLNAADREAGVDRLTGPGATVVETKAEITGPDTETWTVMRDPEGNGFRVQAPG